MNAAPCGSHPTFIGSVLEKCSRISPDRHYTISVKETGPEGRLQSQGHITSFVLNIKALGRLYHKCKGRIGGTAKREEAAPADSQFGTSRIVCAYDIKALGRLYHKGIVRDHRLVVQRLPPEEKHLMQCKKSVFHCQRHRGPSEGMAPGPGPPHIVCHQA